MKDEMTRGEIEMEIRKRMAAGPFRFRDLRAGLPDSAYRLADLMIQKRRKAGEIYFKRVGRDVIWYVIPRYE